MTVELNATYTITPSATETPIPSTETATTTSTRQAIARTATLPATVQPSPLPPTHTPLASITPENLSSATQVISVTEIVTTPKPSPTKNKPTPQPTATATHTPSPTDSPTPTLTRTATMTPTATLTYTPRPTETSGIRPTPTGTLTPPSQPTIYGCVAPQNWFAYVVRQGDTLFSIAQMVGSSVMELQIANCISDINNIYAGNTVLVPRQPAVSPAQSNPVPPAGAAETPVYAQGCTDPNSVITNLYAGQTASGTFPVMGTASLPDFVYYKIEVRPDFATVFNFYSRSETPIINGQLGQIDQTIFGKGLYWIRLTVIGTTSGATPCTIPVIFQ